MKNIFFSIFTLIIAVLISSILAKPIDPTKIIIALNCGSNTQQVSAAEANYKYVPDQSYVKGQSVDADYHNDEKAVDSDIKFALDKQIYMYQRHTYQQMVYELPIKKGKHTIIMKFAQMYFERKGQRVFNIKIGDTIVLENFDVIERSGGKYAAHEEYLEVDVRKDGVYFNENRIERGLQNNKLKLGFAKGKVDNPIVQAIIVYQDTIENSPQKQFQLMKSKWSTQQQMLKSKKEQKELKELINIQKKKESIVIRNDQLVIEEQSSSSQGKSSNNSDKYGMIRNLLMGPIGVIFWSFAFVYGFMLVSKKLFLIESTNKIRQKND